MKIYADVRCLQDENFAFRGVGYHSSVLLRNSRRYFSRSCELVGLIDARLPALPPSYAQLVDRTQYVFAADASPAAKLFVQLSPMTSDPIKTARLVGQPGILSCAVVYDFIPLDVSDRYLPSADSINGYAEQLGWLAAFDRYFPISQYSARRLEEVLPVERSAVHVTGVALRPAFEVALGQRRLESRPTAGLPGQFILFVGGGDPRKNLDVLLLAHSQLLASHPDMHLVVVGNYAPAHVNAIRDIYRGHGGNAWKLHFRHGVDDEQLAQLYRLAACTVCSSYIEGFSLPVIEAVACGSLLLASDNDAHRELIRDQRALFPASDASALSAGLRRVFDEPGFAEELAGAQREVPTRFSQAAVCDRFWLPIARAMRQRSGRTCTVSLPAARPNRPRIAILSPYPPEKSGVADYTRRTVQALGLIADVDVYTDCAAPMPTPEVRNFFPLSDWPFISGEYDNTLTVVGNSHYHIKIIELQREHGGPCLIHDNRLAELYNWWKGPEYFRELASRTLGRTVSLAESQDWIANPGKLPSVFFDELIPTASPLILHSRGIQAQCRKQYGIEAAYVPFSCYRNFDGGELTVTARRAARVALGIPLDEVAIISLGIVGSTKAPEVCIRALAQFCQAGTAAHLYFVGSAGNMQAPLEALARDLGIAGKIHFTGDWVSEETYKQYVLAADFAIQLRNHFFGGLSGAMLDCIASGLVTIANDDLAEALESPSFVLRIRDDLQHEQVAAQLIEAHRAGLNHDRLKPSRQEYLREHSFERYAIELLHAVGLAISRRSVQQVA